MHCRVVTLLLGALVAGCRPGPPHAGQDEVPAHPFGEIASTGNTTNDSFEKAKKLLRGVYADHRVTIYCGCSYSADMQLDFTACGYIPKNDTKRAHRIEWEHVVPAEAFGQSFSEWRDGHPDCVDTKGKAFKGRTCARKASPAFRYMEADIYNLYPEIGELNGLRSNYSMAEIPGEPRDFGTCDVEIADRKLEPRPEVRGDIARTYLYMDAAYPGRGIISGKSRHLFEAWSAQDPVDQWECDRTRQIKAIQGNENGVVMGACRRAGLWTSRPSNRTHHRGESEQMRTTLKCPKCEGRQFYEVGKCSIPNPESSNSTTPLSVAAAEMPAGSPDLCEHLVGLRLTALLSAWVCAHCGYTEFYVGQPAVLARLAQYNAGTVRMIDATPGTGGPFR